MKRNVFRWLLALMSAVGIVLALAPASLAQEPDVPPLAEPGPYGVGMRSVDFVDEARDDRDLEGLIWYPAQAGKSSYMLPAYEAEPDTSGAPYPLVIYSHYLGGNANTTLGAGPHLASYGFVVVSVWHQDPDPFFPNFVQRPQDVLFVLDQMAAFEDHPLAGLVDTDHVGVTGYSLGGVTSVLMSGARVDPDYLQNWCATGDNALTMVCDPLEDWQELAALRSQYDPVEDGELWPAAVDDRILAVVPMAPCRGPMFGVDGLAAATVPTLIIAGSEDQHCEYWRDAVFMFEHLGSPEHDLVTMIGADHMEPLEMRDFQRIMNHFATAFFGYHLQGKVEYAAFLTPESAAEIAGVVWGPVTVE